MKNFNTAAGLLSLLLLPNFAQGQAHPRPPEAGTMESENKKPRADEENYPSNVGAQNEGGGSANTTGMNSGLSPNSSGSGTGSARAGDTSGFSFGEGASQNTGTATGTTHPEYPDYSIPEKSK